MTDLKWKFLDLSGARIASRHDGSPWTLGEWRQQEGILALCHNGFHASGLILDALGYVPGEVLARVEVDGDAIERDDKSVHERMRIVKAYRWAKRDSVMLAVYAAELVLNIFEVRHPDDDRPRKAIEATKAWLSSSADAAASAAFCVASALSSDAAFSAATSFSSDAAAAAASAAYCAATASSSDADAAAASAAYCAAAALSSSAYASARRELRTKIETWLQAHVIELEEIA